MRRMLTEKPALRDRIERAKAQNSSGGTIFDVEHERVRNVVLKLARGHCAYELNEPRREEPDSVMVLPYSALTTAQVDHFEAVPGGPISVWPEVGSRAFQRLIIADDAYHMGWLTVQHGRYRFLVQSEGSTISASFSAAIYPARSSGGKQTVARQFR